MHNIFQTIGEKWLQPAKTKKKVLDDVWMLDFFQKGYFTDGGRRDTIFFVFKSDFLQSDNLF